MFGGKNRFAGLKIDDDDDAAETKGGSANQNQSNAAAKKKNKKKKSAVEEAQLRNWAFGTGRPSGKQQAVKNTESSGEQRKSAQNHEWDEWQRRDTEVMEDMYEQDLKQALLNSKLEAEQQKEAQRRREAELKAAGLPLNMSGAAAASKKKKKKDKPQPMTLDQFNQMPAERIPGSDDEEEVENIPAPANMRVPTECQDTQYFDSISSDASRILQKERIQEEYQKLYAHESAMQFKYQEDIEKLKMQLKESEELRKNDQEELKKVKGRYRKVCTVLAEADVKDKASIIRQAEDLTKIKDELTEQLAEANAELEKERSKNHALKLENDKLKGKYGK